MLKSCQAADLDYRANPKGKQESTAVADKPARRCWNPGHGSLKGIESDTIRLLAYGLLLPSHSKFVSKMHRFRDMATYWSKISLKTYPHLIWHVPWGDPVLTPCEFFDESYFARKWNHGAIRWCTFHDPAFALLDKIPAVTDGQMDGRTDRWTRCCRKDRATHNVTWVKSNQSTKFITLYICSEMKVTEYF